VREEIPQLVDIKSLDQMDLLARALPSRVGAPLSLNNLRQNIQVSFKSVQNWMIIFEKRYLIFRLSPFGAPKLKAVKKEQKHYHYDWNLIDNDGHRFENMIACHLLKWAQFQEDAHGRELELRYFRDELGREIDFVVTEKSIPILFVEAKLFDTEVSSHLRYLKTKFPKVRSVQVCLQIKKEYVSGDGIEVLPALKFLNELI
jgi:uncharacterized protein